MLMLRHWIAAAAALLTASAASAQTNWTGFYAGVSGFGSRAKLDATDTLFVNQISNLFVVGRGIVVVPGTSRDLDASGSKTNAHLGGQLGFQWQTGQFVLGAE